MGESTPTDEFVVNFHGRVAAGLPLAGRFARVTASVIDPDSDEVISQVEVGDDGSLRGPLPSHLRGQQLEVVLSRVTNGSSEEVARLPFRVPTTGDAMFHVPAALGADEVLGLSSRILTPELLKARVTEKARYLDAIADARRQAFADIPDLADERPESPTLFAQLVEPLFQPALALPKGASLIDFILEHPVPALLGARSARHARLRLTEDEQARLGAHPTLWDALGTRAHRFGLRRKRRLSERLEIGLRIDSLSLPTAPAVPDVPPPDAGQQPTVDELALEAEKVVLAKTASVVADLVPRPGEPTTSSDLTRLHGLAGTLELASGAANVTAAKDVHVLQLAYRAPLRRKWGRDLLVSVKDLDRLRIELERSTGIRLPLVRGAATTRAELEELIDDSQRLVQRAMELEEPPEAVGRVFPTVNAATWGRLSDEARLTLSAHALAGSSTAAPGTPGTMQTMGLIGGIVGGALGLIVGGPAGAVAGAAIGSGIEDTVDAGSGDEQQTPSAPVISFTPHKKLAPYAPLSPSILALTDTTLARLRQRLKKGSYEFDIYEPGSVNYGLMLTYRQEWSPVRYQVGRLIDTIPLTPGEKREVKVVTTRKRHDARSSLTNEARESTVESTSTSRLESEAIEAATIAVNNQISANGSFTIGVATIGGSADFTHNSSEESRRTLKNFSELTRKAVDTLKNQVEIKVESSEDYSSEVTDLRTVSNANNEITVTFLLYELERRYRVETQLASVRPVVLYALDVPGPDEITAAWILEYSDQIRRFLLDPTLRPVLDDLERTHSSADLDYRMAVSRLAEQRRIYTSLATEIDELEAAVAALTKEAGDAAVGAAAAEAAEPGVLETIGTAIATGGISLLLPSGSADDETLDARARAHEKLIQELNRKLDTRRAAIASAAGAISAAYESYQTKALARSRSRLAEGRLAVHIRDNIFHYMHGIWSTTHPDHRYFELHDKHVPFHTPQGADYALTSPTAPSVVAPLPGIDMLGDDRILTITKPSVDGTVRRPLAEIADIDRPLGFRGNFVVFELRECSQLTDYMAAEFVDPDTGVTLPGAVTGLSTTELLDYLEAAIGHGLVSENQFEALKDLVRRITHEQDDWADDVVLPTGQVMLETLKGETTLLEPFKLVHRGIDVIAAEEDVRAKRLDALRRARRVATGDLERDPTTVERFSLREAHDVEPA